MLLRAVSHGLREASNSAIRRTARRAVVLNGVSAISRHHQARSSSNESYGSSREETGELPPLVAKAQADTEEDPDYNTMKDGLAIKQATAVFAGRRRFYKQVNIRESRALNGMIEYEIVLDGHSLKTPGTERPYRIPSKGLAIAIALEWDQQVTYKGIEPVYMPLTGIATIALDEIIFSKQQAIERCLRYLSSDTVCYLFPDGEDDRKLLERQQKRWEPLLQWMKDDFGIDVARPDHMLSIAENTPVTLAKIDRLLREMDAFTLAATLSLVLDLKSVVTALALVFRRVTVEEACYASALEEKHQQATWGEVDLYHELDDKVLNTQASAASTFLWLLEENPLAHMELKSRIQKVLKKEFSQ